MAKLILHIGMHKTGTSTLQQTLHKSSINKEIKSFNYLTVNQANHSYIMTAAFTSNENISYYKYCKTISSDTNGVMPKGNWKRDNARAVLKEQVEKTIKEDKDLVISAEDLCILTPCEVRDMKNFFLSCGIDEFQIIAYIRDPQSWSVSYAQQVIKQGLQTIEEILSSPSIPRYKDFFKKYVDIFKSENCLFLPFLRNKMVNNCIVSDFLIKTNLLNLDELKEITKKIKINNSNQSVNLKTLQAVSTIVKSKRNGEITQLGMISDVRKLFNNTEDKKFSLTKKATEMVIRSAKDDIYWMASQNENLSSVLCKKEVATLDESDLLAEIKQTDWLKVIDKLKLEQKKQNRTK